MLRARKGHIDGFGIKDVMRGWEVSCHLEAYTRAFRLSGLSNQVISVVSGLQAYQIVILFSFLWKNMSAIPESHKNCDGSQLK